MIRKTFNLAGCTVSHFEWAVMFRVFWENLNITFSYSRNKLFERPVKGNILQCYSSWPRQYYSFLVSFRQRGSGCNPTVLENFIITKNQVLKRRGCFGGVVQ